MKRNTKIYAADFETTVYKGQKSTEVWAASCCELYTEDAQLFHSIEQQWNYFVRQHSNLIVYYHNIKFDGSFWLNFFLKGKKFKLAYEVTNQETGEGYWLSRKDMPNNSVACTISNMGQWYLLVVKVRGKIIEFRDSLKLLPFTLKRIGKAFKTKHQKLEMDYEGCRYPGCKITQEERDYIINDVLVLKEAMEYCLNNGHNRLTIGSCCLAEYKEKIGPKLFDEYFPDMVNFAINAEQYGAKNLDEYVRASYHGGWCYAVRTRVGGVVRSGLTIDVNSLYPSMMHSISNNRYPVGEPTMFVGRVPNEAKAEDKYYFVRIRTRFYLKKGKLPFIQIKHSCLYKGTEMLETSDVWDPVNQCYCESYRNNRGEEIPSYVTLTLTQTDYQLMKEHYILVDCQELDGCYFKAVVGLFDAYINPHAEAKKHSKGAEREMHKLYLNNLYGKMASSTNSSYKVPYVKEDGSIGFYTVNANEKIAGYIPVGSAITSYSREFTIRTAQKNYHGKDKPGFIYADTDSIHADLAPEDLQGVKLDPAEFCCWKLEAQWDKGLFVRQKTYVEHITIVDGEPLDNPYYNVKCAGMPQRCKDLFIRSMEIEDYDERIHGTPAEREKGWKEKYNEQEQEFLKEHRTLEDFNVGLAVPGKLMPRQIPGGVLLVDSMFEMR